MTTKSPFGSASIAGRSGVADAGNAVEMVNCEPTNRPLGVTICPATVQVVSAGAIWSQTATKSPLDSSVISGLTRVTPSPAGDNSTVVGLAALAFVLTDRGPVVSFVESDAVDPNRPDRGMMFPTIASGVVEF